MLDTSAYSAFMRGHAAVVSAVRRAERIVLSPIAIGELKAGFRGGSRSREHAVELSQFLASPRVQVVDLTTNTAERYAAIVDYLSRAGTPVPTNDAWIAASAMEHGLIVLTTDRHYERMPQVVSEYYDIEGDSPPDKAISSHASGRSRLPRHEPTPA
jgi:tRNA(fMet)-specific endonuclease VapC